MEYTLCSKGWTWSEAWRVAGYFCVALGASAAFANAANPPVRSARPHARSVRATPSNPAPVRIGKLDTHTVSIAAATGPAQETTSQTASFIVSRTGDLSADLAVSFSVETGAGQADPSRYTLSPASQITIPAGLSSATLTVIPGFDASITGDQSITVDLATDPSYAISNPGNAAVMLLDSPINRWKIAQFGSVPAAQGTGADDDADPAGDGITNLTKYALGLPALLPASGPVATVQIQRVSGSKHLVMSIVRPSPPPPDVAYNFEETTALSSGLWLPGVVSPGYPTDNGNGTETVVAQDPQPAETEIQSAMRLRVSRTASAVKRGICATKAWDHSSGVYLTFGTPGKVNTTFRSRHVATANASNISVLFGDCAAEDLGLTAVTIKASIETLSGTITPLTFAGSPSVTIQPGKYASTDALTNSLAAGTAFYVRVNLNMAHGSYISSYPMEDTGEGYAGGDATAGGAIESGFTGFTYAPFAIYGDVAESTPIIGLIGDSIMEGYQSGDGDGTNFLNSFGQVALGPNYGASFSHIQLAQVGEPASALAALYPALSLRTPLLKGCNYAIDNYGINDIHNNTNATLGTLQASVIGGWQNLWLLYGIKTYHCTLTPLTADSADAGFWFSANETILSAATEAIRTGFNDWLRDGAPLDPRTLNALSVGTAGGSGCVRFGQSGHPAFGFFDTADQAETGRNSGIWKDGYTQDGIHPSGHVSNNAMATAINTAVFQ